MKFFFFLFFTVILISTFMTPTTTALKADNSDNDDAKEQLKKGDFVYDPIYSSQSIILEKENQKPKPKEKKSRYQWDENGYLMFCLCMGRFGNQADHLLGSMAFAKALNRTLVIPPFISYPPNYGPIQMTPFTDLFQLSHMQSYHKAIPMETFFELFAAEKWPKGKREGQCYSNAPTTPQCKHKEGNPFGPFWDSFGVDFDSFRGYNMLYNADPHTISRWNTLFPPSTHPVLALNGAPANFPVNPEHRSLQRFWKWNNKMQTKRDNYVNSTLTKPYVGIHMRNGVDWVRACDLTKDATTLMGSPQCHGPNFHLTKEICYPPNDQVVKQVVDAVKKKNAASLFIATDDRNMKSNFEAAFKKENLDIKMFQLPNDDPHLDLAILGEADYFIGNCVSTFTSFAKRYRDIHSKPSTFWGLSDN